jgi:hypothetical protein
MADPTSPEARKTCPGCRQNLPRSDFGRSASRRDGCQVYCRPCMRVRNKRHYERHHSRRRAAIVAWNRRRRDEHARLVYEFVLSHPCVDCGESDPIVLECDHIRGQKRAAVEHLVSVACSRDVLVSELEKCVVRCANCHRRRTAAIQRSRRYQLTKGGLCLE